MSAPTAVMLAADTVEITGGVLSTVTPTAAAVAVFPAASRATAVRLCVPLAGKVVFQETEYGATVSSAPRLTPSSLNWTPATPTIAEAEVETAPAVPETVPTLAGAVSETVGGVVSRAVL